jgi:hypothetical protein
LIEYFEEVSAMKLRCAAVIIAALLIFAASPVFAGESSTATVNVSIVIKGGNLSIDATDLNFEPIDLSTGIHTSITENTITVNDPTGTGAGWNVTVRGSDLIAQDTSQRLFLEDLEFEVLKVSCSRASRNEGSGIEPVEIGQRMKMTYNDQKLLSAEKGTGLGKFSIKPTYQLTVPNHAKPGRYLSNLTYTLFQGP